MRGGGAGGGGGGRLGPRRASIGRGRSSRRRWRRTSSGRHRSTGAQEHRYTCAPVHLCSCTPVLLYNCPVLLYSRTGVGRADTLACCCGAAARVTDKWSRTKGPVGLAGQATGGPDPRPAVVSPCSPAARGERARGLLRWPHHALAARRPTPARPRPAHLLVAAAPRLSSAPRSRRAIVSRRLCHDDCVKAAVSRRLCQGHLPAACHNKTRPCTLSVPAPLSESCPGSGRTSLSPSLTGREGQGGAGAPSGGDGRDSSRARPTPAVGPVRGGVGLPGQGGATAARVC